MTERTNLQQTADLLVDLHGEEALFEALSMAKAGKAEGKPHCARIWETIAFGIAMASAAEEDKLQERLSASARAEI